MPGSYRIHDLKENLPATGQMSSPWILEKLWTDFMSLCKTLCSHSSLFQEVFICYWAAEGCG